MSPVSNDENLDFETAPIASYKRNGARAASSESVFIVSKSFLGKTSLFSPLSLNNSCWCVHALLEPNRLQSFPGCLGERSLKVPTELCEVFP